MKGNPIESDRRAAEVSPAAAAAERMRAACLDAALRAYEDAGIQGLCAEGRWEAAVAAVRRLDIREVIEGGR